MITATIVASVGNIEFAGNHPNGMPWSGILLVTDQISDQAPNGADGHKIFVPANVAQKQLHTLVGMGLNYRASRDGHQTRNKVGVITEAWMEGKAVKVKGVIWKKDFPEAEKDLKGQKLGMSMELANVRVSDRDDKVWKLEDFVFTGATALWPKAAAYHRTALAASKFKGGSTVDKKKKTAPKKTEVQILAAAVTGALDKGLTSMQKMIADQNKVLIQILASNKQNEEDPEEAAAKKLQSVLANGETATDDEDIDASSDDVETDDSDDINAEEDKEEEEAEEEMEEEAEEEEEEEEEEEAVEAKNVKAGIPPQFLKNIKKKSGNKTVVKAMAAAASEIGTLRASVQKLDRVTKAQDRTIKRQTSLIRKMEAQQDAFAEHINRRTLPPEASALLEKAGIDVPQLIQSGQKLSVENVNQILAEGAPGLDVKSRMGIKNVLLQKGLMDQGVVDRNYGGN